MIQCGHAHHDHQHEDFIAIVERACKAKGLRLTEIRKRVLQLVAAEDKPVKAYDLLSQLGDERGRSTAPPTVYRALEFLLEHGFVDQIVPRAQLSERIARLLRLLGAREKFAK